MLPKTTNDIPLSAITVPEKYRRDESLNFRAEQKTLIQSIRAVGLRFPITVKANGKGYVLIDGYRRLRALHRMRSETISAYVIPAGDRTNTDTLRFQLNIHRENLKPMDEAKLIRALIVEEGWTKANVAKALGKKVSTINRALDCLRTSSKWQKLVNDRRINMHDIQPVAALSPKGQHHAYMTIKTRGLPFNRESIRSVVYAMDPIKHPEWFQNPKQVAGMRINERHGHPVTYRKVEDVARLRIITEHRERLLKKYEDEITVALPVITKIMETPEVREALPGRSIKAFTEFLKDYQ